MVIAQSRENTWSSPVMSAVGKVMGLSIVSETQSEMGLSRELCFGSKRKQQLECGTL